MAAPALPELRLLLRKKFPQAHAARFEEAPPDAPRLSITDPATFPWKNDTAPRETDPSKWVVYQLHVGSFLGEAKNADRSTLEDLTARLDYFKKLGVNTLELDIAITRDPGSSYASEPAVLIQAHITHAALLVIATPDTFEVRGRCGTDAPQVRDREDDREIAKADHDDGHVDVELVLPGDEQPAERGRSRGGVRQRVLDRVDPHRVEGHGAVERDEVLVPPADHHDPRARRDVDGEPDAAPGHPRRPTDGGRTPPTA